MSNPQTRELLFEVALNLIWQSGYNAVGVNEICRSAGVTKGSFYHHFDSKAALFKQATEFYMEQVKADLDSIMSPVHEPLEKLKMFLGFMVEHKFGRGPDNVPGCAYLSAGSQQCPKSEPQIHEALQNMLNMGLVYNIALLRDLQGQGYLEDGVDLERSARYMHQYMQGALIHAKVLHLADQVAKDLPEAYFRLMGLKPEYWFEVKVPEYSPECCD